eukprot:3506554-Rhodomonas_salina.1
MYMILTCWYTRVSVLSNELVLVPTGFTAERGRFSTRYPGTRCTRYPVHVFPGTGLGLLTS